jgi:hypothetical protein
MYPKDILTSSRTGLSRQAFVMMPFSNELEKTYVIIRDACKGIGLNCLRADSLYDAKPILTKIIENIVASQVLIADLTKRNPNVFYEIGIAHSSRRVESVILISQSLDDVPFDLRHLPILIYEQGEELKFRIELQDRIKFSLATTDSINTIFNLVFGGDRNAQQATEFIDYLTKIFPQKIQIISDIVNDNINNNNLFNEAYWAIVLEIDGASDRYKKKLQLLAISLLSTKYAMREQIDFVKEQLKPVLNSQYNNLADHNKEVIAQLCFNSIELGFLKKECIDWLITYLHNPKVGNVDVLRSQIENWLSSNIDIDVEAVLITTLNSAYPHMREAAADILGMRKNKKLVLKINEALLLETDPYAGRSMINALSRLDARACAQTIINWVLNNSHLWDSAEPKSPSIPKTATQALKNIGCDANEINRFEFEILQRRS